MRNQLDFWFQEVETCLANVSKMRLCHQLLLITNQSVSFTSSENYLALYASKGQRIDGPVPLHLTLRDRSYAYLWCKMLCGVKASFVFGSQLLFFPRSIGPMQALSCGYVFPLKLVLQALRLALEEIIDVQTTQVMPCSYLKVVSIVFWTSYYLSRHIQFLQASQNRSDLLLPYRSVLIFVSRLFTVPPSVDIVSSTQTQSGRQKLKLCSWFVVRAWDKCTSVQISNSTV